MHAGKVVKPILVLGLLSLVFPTRACAYIDPGTGTYALQMAVAGMLAAGYVVKVFWRKIVAAVSSPFRRGTGDRADGR